MKKTLLTLHELESELLDTPSVPLNDPSGTSLYKLPEGV